ncbi:hypothetical protein M0R89_05250 [Halorussus limi]|uniref:Uncharacterized protein n=1 Tax=Halorussus limi TaxID=2938695 RepID=A0A8U0HWH8_9EURY|nr:hypothetical protein [Halorussus limi]UPV75475.1 hypothetical protein M0R89_05250 [Halorussus limi]
MPLPHPSLSLELETLALAAAAVLVPLVLATLVYADARRRRGSPRSRGASLAPVAWGATTFFSGVGCVVVAACYVAVRGR